MRLDIRQESTRHTEAITELCSLLDDTVDYASLDETARQQYLTRALAKPPPDIDRSKLGEESRETLEVFDVMRHMQGEISPNAFGNYVVSMTHSASHILEVMVLAWIIGLGPAAGSSPLASNGSAGSASVPCLKPSMTWITLKTY